MEDWDFIMSIHREMWKSREIEYGVGTVNQNVLQSVVLHEPIRRGAWQYQVIQVNRISGESRLNDRGDYLCAAVRNSLQ